MGQTHHQYAKPLMAVTSRLSFCFNHKNSFCLLLFIFGHPRLLFTATQTGLQFADCTSGNCWVRSKAVQSLVYRLFPVQKYREKTKPDLTNTDPCVHHMWVTLPLKKKPQRQHLGIGQLDVMRTIAVSHQSMIN